MHMHTHLAEAHALIYYVLESIISFLKNQSTFEIYGSVLMMSIIGAGGPRSGRRRREA